jgi:enamine deaminase RidA (YjgF/YER057c/UK114 family)
LKAETWCRKRTAGEVEMERQVVNPWTWQDPLGFVQANKTTGAVRIAMCAGQLSVDADGRPLHPGDMSAQIEQALDNVETVLHEAVLKFSDVVRLNYYVTDIDEFIAAGATLSRRLLAGDCRPASTLLNVVRLAYPESMVEIEATALA